MASVPSHNEGANRGQSAWLPRFDEHRDLMVVFAAASIAMVGIVLYWIPAEPAVLNGFSLSMGWRLGLCLAAGVIGVVASFLFRQWLQMRLEGGEFLHPPVRIALLAIGLYTAASYISLSVFQSKYWSVAGIAVAITVALILALSERTQMPWIHFHPIHWAPLDQKAGIGGVPVYLMTGPDLIDEIARAVELGQSVILAGPRGCGKSYCVKAALELAADRGILEREPQKSGVPSSSRRIASRFLQGNRETPRDYLVEDEIVFETKSVGAKIEVIPKSRPAPLFAFAKRDPSTGKPLANGKRITELYLDPDNPTTQLKRFVLFLDELNRFSDGVLDSLLTVLEERKAVLAGVEYELPVVVCMTMNPPGYDATARALSPPLAARIGRSYRLYSPDLDTLTDQIVDERIDELTKAIPAGLPEVPFPLRRKAALTTLCLWGNVADRQVDGDDESALRPGNEYLTTATRAMLADIRANDAVISSHMDALTDLCRFGPDGRAAADWLTAAIGLALSESSKKVTEEHLLRSARVAVSHKLYDTFSQGARPDKTARKETAVEACAYQVLFSDSETYLRYVKREVDDASKFIGMAAQLSNGPVMGAIGVAPAMDASSIRRVFTKSGLIDFVEAKKWIDVIHSFAASEAAPRKSLRRNDLTAFIERLHHRGIFEFSIVNGKHAICFATKEHEKFATALVRLESPSNFIRLLAMVLKLKRLPVRQSAEDKVANVEIVQRLGVKRICSGPVELPKERLSELAETLQFIWAQDCDFDQQIDVCVKRTKDRVNQDDPKIKQQVMEILADRKPGCLRHHGFYQRKKGYRVFLTKLHKELQT